MACVFEGIALNHSGKHDIIDNSALSGGWITLKNSPLAVNVAYTLLFLHVMFQSRFSKSAMTWHSIKNRNIKVKYRSYFELVFTCTKLCHQRISQNIPCPWAIMTIIFWNVAAIVQKLVNHNVKSGVVFTKWMHSTRLNKRRLKSAISIYLPCQEYNGPGKQKIQLKYVVWWIIMVQNHEF